MEDILLIIVALFAVYYVYRTIFKNDACNCGSKKCPTSKNKKNEQ
ncbi:MAG: FeoB-associated Cys-rich membrane protein [Halarcobacter sp.]